jgi:hypothetical protein
MTPYHFFREYSMNESKSSGRQNKQSGSNETEQDIASQRGKKDDKSSRDAKSNVKAGSNTGAGGGSKQKQKH